jgi:hypothetical protein
MYSFGRLFYPFYLKILFPPLLLPLSGVSIPAAAAALPLKLLAAAAG